MRRLFSTAAILMAVLTAEIHSSSNLLANDNPAPLKAPGLGDPGKLTSIAIESGCIMDGKVIIAGRDAYQQLIVTGAYETGQTRDLSRKVTYTVSPENIVKV